MKKQLLALFVLFFTTVAVAQSGLTCEDAIVLTKDYEATITGPCELWYTANTYDLPIHVHFTPASSNSTYGPEVEIDLTCTPGVYDDPMIDSLVNLVSDFSISFPVSLPTDYVVNQETGKVEWDLSVNKSYREQLAEFGVIYPVTAFVKVRYYEAGKVTLSPDTLFSSCMSTAKMVSLGDTISIEPNDEQSVFVFPYIEWKNDSVRFVWIGDDKANVYVAEQECDFTPSSAFVFDSFTVDGDVPHKLYSNQMSSFVENHTGGGIFFAKVIAPSAGKLVVEKIPMSLPAEGADLLVYDQTVQVKSGEQLYCFPRTWASTQITAQEGCSIQMIVSATADFMPSVSDANVIAVHDFVIVDGKRTLQLSTAEMNKMISSAKSDYLYVRFLADATVNVTPTEWVASDCIEKSYLLSPNKQQTITANSASVIYRVRYSDFSNYDLTIKWTGASSLPTYIAETCNFSLSSSNAALLVKPAFSISRKGSRTIDAATVDAWAPRIPEDGFFYIRFNPTNQGNVTLITEKKEETPVVPDPVYTTIADTVCYGVTYEWNGQKYTTSGEYQQTLLAANGADSVVTLNLVVLSQVQPVVTDVTVEYGKTYEWNDKVYAETTTDTITFQDTNGCDYLAILKLTVLDKPASPCVLKSIELKINDQLTLNLDSAFTIYRINYTAWVATGATLSWSGVEPLHTFVAETCEFAVAPYNKYVHAYVTVPAEGVAVLDKAKLTELAAYVDEDGYLYVRFLSEKEGVLEVK